MGPSSTQHGGSACQVYGSAEGERPEAAADRIFQNLGLILHRENALVQFYDEPHLLPRRIALSSPRLSRLLLLRLRWAISPVLWAAALAVSSLFPLLLVLAPRASPSSLLALRCPAVVPTLLVVSAALRGSTLSSALAFVFLHIYRWGVLGPFFVVV